MAQIIDYFESDRQQYWLKKIGDSDWSAGKYLHELIRDNRLRKLCGETTKVLLLTEGDELVSFCTYAMQDDVPEPSLSPWVGFVYTFPAYRGKRRMGELLQRVSDLAKADGYEYLLVSTCENGLYEKYGFSFWKMMKDRNGDECRVLRLKI